MGTSTLTLRARGRALLARQMLLAREESPCGSAVASLGGLQAQLARPPHISLFSRIEGYRREDLIEAVTRRELVRATMMRGTLHIVSAADYTTLRPALQPMLTKGLRSVLRERADALDIDGLLVATRAYLQREGPRTFEDIRDHLESLGLPGDERARGFGVRMTLPLIQVPDGSAWGYPSNCAFALSDDWLAAGTGQGERGGRGPAPKAPRAQAPDGQVNKARATGASGPEGEVRTPEDREDALVLFYLRAFGPATVADAQTWSGLTPLKATFERLRPRLITFRDERGKELFDLPEAPRPDPDTPAPARFLPEFDSLILAHDDRSHLLDDAHRKIVYKPNLRILPTFLVDGRVAGTWDLDAKKKTATLEMVPFAKLSKRNLEELTAEAEGLLRFVEPGAKAHEVRVVTPAKGTG